MCIRDSAVVWGFLGVWIAAMMKTLSIGVPAVAESFGIEGVAAAMKGEKIIHHSNEYWDICYIPVSSPLLFQKILLYIM